MRRLHHVPLPRVFLAAAAIGLLVAGPAFPSGFQVMTQGAKATGMGLAFAGVADDPSAIFYNPAGIGFQDHFAVQGGAAVLGRDSATFVGTNPYPGVGAVGQVQNQVFALPQLYIVVPLTTDLKFGLGIDAPYGLGLRWDVPELWSGRFISQNVVIKTTDINPVLSYRLLPELSIAAGADYRFSGVQLERNTAAVDPFTQAEVDVAHTKLYSDLTSNGAWGYNVGILWKPAPSVGIGASYRSKITVDYDGTATITPRPTGDQVFDQLVATQVPFGVHPVATQIEFPASINTGVGIDFGAGFTVALEADWTQWSDFKALNITFPGTGLPDIDRQTNWSDSWAYRIGLEKKFGAWAIRAGYYYDNTPQPTKDVGPLLADNDRNVYTGGFGYNTPTWGVDIGGAYIKLKQRSVTTESTDNFFGIYNETAWAAVADLRISF
ncbi:MAG TPA: outer membrane protein transport protein [Thermoanaerobaculia bacterium]|nr:outer membrane protein transport protein [Thermoanaerobaculia bacterium]